MKILKFSTLLLISISSIKVYATIGGMSGGGGQGIVCRDSAGEITKVETLDLFEARELYGLSERRFNGTLSEALIQLKKELTSSMDQPAFHLFPLIDRVQKIWKFVGADVVIKPIDDAATVAIPANCEIEQLASYVDDDLLLIKKDLWDKLDIRNQAALVLHEAVYRLERYDGAADSRRARKFVGHAISGFEFEAVRASLPSEAKFCSTSDGAYSFAYYPKTVVDPTRVTTMTQLQFLRFENRWVFSKKTAVIPMSLPWHQNLPKIQCIDWPEGCLLTGGETQSRYEGHGFVHIGARHIVTPNSSKFNYFIESANGRHQLECMP